MGATASHVVGLVDVDNKGLAGIEKFIDDNPQLAMAADEAVTLSLDLGVQHVLREELGRAIATYRAKAAAGIVIDVHSGEVLALASLPDYDPNRREQALDKDPLNSISTGAYARGKDGTADGRRSPSRLPQEARPVDQGSNRARRERRPDHSYALAEAEHH